MTNRTDAAARSAIMSRVRSKNTGPEIKVRQALHRAGFRFRIHRSDLPGTPDLVLSKYRLAVFVHGCFWHRHGCKRTTMPATNRQFWSEKFRRTVDKDARVLRELAETGWTTAVIWECQLDAGVRRLADLLARTHRHPSSIRSVLRNGGNLSIADFPLQRAGPTTSAV